MDSMEVLDQASTAEAFSPKVTPTLFRVSSMSLARLTAATPAAARGRVMPTVALLPTADMFAPTLPQSMVHCWALALD